MRNKLNLFSALVFQFVSIISGLIVPRLIITVFGSEVNGLVCSITKFLSFISVLEGGVGAVVLAELYKPIEEHNNTLISHILNKCERFFKKLSAFFLIHTTILIVIYPVFITRNFDFSFIGSLIFILSITTLMQYMFSITYKLFLQANQQIYVCNFVSSITVVLNLILTLIVVCNFPSIHLVKICSSFAFLIQPIIYNHYINKHYSIDKNNKSDEIVFKEKKSGFSQNLAHFINMNTDIMIITVFLSLSEVSIYSVYMLALNSLVSIISAGANSFQAALGKYIATGNMMQLKKKFRQYEMLLWYISVVFFSTCLILINPFVKIYTIGVYDIDYYRPIFGLVMVIAQFLFSARESYRYLILAGGKFKDTNFGAILEAIINIVVSIVLVNLCGIVGVAIGTLAAIIYRLFYFIYYLKDNIISLNISTFVSCLLSALTVFTINFIAYFRLELNIENLWAFLEHGFLVLGLEIVLSSCVFYLFQVLCGLNTISELR